MIKMYYCVFSFPCILKEKEETMIHLSLPLKPRVDDRCEYLLTPISVISEKDGKKILCLTDIKDIENTDVATKYTEILSSKLGDYDRVIRDSDPIFVNFALSLIMRTLEPFIKQEYVRVCTCGAYEELEGVRMFGLRRVKNNVCTFCNTKLQKEERQVLMSEIIWPDAKDFPCNHTWVGVDLKHFLERQVTTYKISKQKEIARLPYCGIDFGIRCQILWSAMIAYLVKVENDNDVVLHYVNQVQDKAFFVSLIAKAMCPDINVYLKALPLVWIDESPSIAKCHPSHVKLLRNTLNTKRKKLQVSLKSWRYIN